MTKEEVFRRQKAVKLADSINLIEGAPVSPHAELLSQKWAKGEITGAEMKATLLKAHKKPYVVKLP